MWVRIWPHLALFLAMVFWSTSYVALRVALSALDPFTVMAGRMAVATLLFLPLWGGLLRDLRRKGQWRWLLLMALAEPCCYFLLETRALCLTTASQAGMVISLLPLITAVVAWRLLGERVGARGWAGFVLAVTGVVWLSLQSAVDETATAPVLGNFLEGLAMVCAALYTVLARRLSAAYSPLQITAVQSFVGMSFFCALLALAPLDYTPVLLHVRVPDWAPWASVVYLGGIVSLGGYGLYNVGVSRLSAAGAAAYTNLIPILTLAGGVILLREVFLPGQYLASALVVAGVLLSQWGGQGGRRAQPGGKS